MSSTRLPGKPLKEIAGKTLVERVYLQALQCKALTKVVIATDDTQIEKVARAFGAQVVMTSPENETGSDRVAEAARLLGGDFELVANIQGDMPFINPQVIEQTVAALAGDTAFDMSTVASPILDQAEFTRPAAVKVAIGTGGRALYFSRAPIPFWRDQPNTFSPSPSEPYGYKHMGLYVFRKAALQRLSTLTRAQVEKRESLEQLRALANGMAIKVAVVEPALVVPGIEVDTPEDLERARAWSSSNSSIR